MRHLYEAQDQVRDLEVKVEELLKRLENRSLTYIKCRSKRLDAYEKRFKYVIGDEVNDACNWEILTFIDDLITSVDVKVLETF